MAMVRILDGAPGGGGVNVAAKEPITLKLVKRGVFNPTILACVWYVLSSSYPESQRSGLPNFAKVVYCSSFISFGNRLDREP